MAETVRGDVGKHELAVAAELTEGPVCPACAEWPRGLGMPRAVVSAAPGVHGELVRRWQGAQRLAVASVTDPVGLRSPSP